MGKTTGISWATATWNPWLGCTKVSAGCDHCYMYREQRQYGNDPDLVRRSKTKFDEPRRWHDPERIFTCSWGDWFHAEADQWRDEAWQVIRATPQHTYLILTKRPGRIHRCLPDDWGDGWPNVWLGVSVESGEFLSRMKVLREIPAALRFVSAEPLLGSLRYINLDGFGWVIVGGESGPKSQARPMHPTWAREIRDAVLHNEPCEDCHGTGANVGPVCCGNVSADGGCRGDCAVPETIRCEECRGSGLVPLLDRPALHFKQWGSWTPDDFGRDPNGVWVSPDGRTRSSPAADAYDDLPDGSMRMRYAGSSPKAGGKLLDGVDWCEIPDTTARSQLTIA